VVQLAQKKRPVEIRQLCDLLCHFGLQRVAFLTKSARHSFVGIAMPFQTARTMNSFGQEPS
jgi:hypothetical protein